MRGTGGQQPAAHTEQPVRAREPEVFMLRIEVTHTFDVSVAEAFAYITDMKNWPEYWPDFIRIENPAAAAWSNPGDTATQPAQATWGERACGTSHPPAG